MKIIIENLTFKCIIGILDFERIKKQKIVVNLSFSYDYTKENFIDYAQVSKLVKKTMQEEKFELLEDAIIFLESKLYKLYKINNLQLSISKPDILKNCIVTLANN